MTSGRNVGSRPSVPTSVLLPVFFVFFGFFLISSWPIFFFPYKKACPTACSLPGTRWRWVGMLEADRRFRHFFFCRFFFFFFVFFLILPADIFFFPIRKLAQRPVACPVQDGGGSERWRQTVG